MMKWLISEKLRRCEKGAIDPNLNPKLIDNMESNKENLTIVIVQLNKTITKIFHEEMLMEDINYERF